MSLKILNLYSSHYVLKHLIFMQFPICFETFVRCVIPTVLYKHLPYMLFPLYFDTLSFASFPQNQDTFSMKMWQLACS